MIKAYAKSDIGKVREINQDYYYISNSLDEVQLYMLADGMGGYKGGEIASKLAIISAKSYIENNFKEIHKDKESIIQLVASSMEYANMVVYEKAKENLNNVHFETDMIVENAKKTLENIEEQSKNELDEIKEHLEKTLSKDVDREVQNTYNDITSSIAKASSALSYENIKQALIQNPQLHQKYIDECINSIDGLAL